MEHYNPLLKHNDSPKKFFAIGEIMLRLTPPNYEKIRMATNFEASYGGSEANIALSLANLGVDSTFFSVVPNNSLGKSAIRMLRSHCFYRRILRYRTLPPRLALTASNAFPMHFCGRSAFCPRLTAVYWESSVCQDHNKTADKILWPEWAEGFFMSGNHLRKAGRPV